MKPSTVWAHLLAIAWINSAPECFYRHLIVLLGGPLQPCTHGVKGATRSIFLEWWTTSVGTVLRSRSSRGCTRPLSRVSGHDALCFAAHGNAFARREMLCALTRMLWLSHRVRGCHAPRSSGATICCRVPFDGLRTVLLDCSKINVCAVRTCNVPTRGASIFIGLCTIFTVIKWKLYGSAPARPTRSVRDNMYYLEALVKVLALK